MLRLGKVPFFPFLNTIYFIFIGVASFLVMYHMIHVKIKIGKISAPGISSIIEIKPTHRNIKMLAKIPARSRKSPNNGSNRIATIYSLTSNSMQMLRNNNSMSVKTIYLE